MRRLRRILLNAATAVSLLLCVASVALWVRSNWRTDWFRLNRYDPVVERWVRMTLESSRGELFVERLQVPRGKPDDHLDLAFPQGYEFRSFNVDPTNPVHIVGLNPIQYESGGGLTWSGVTIRVLYVKMWLPFACFAVLPAARAARRVLRRRRPAPGACPACGYDLRATPDRCPECGHQPSS